VSLSAVLNSASADPALAAVTTSIAEARLTVIRPSGPQPPAIAAAARAGRPTAGGHAPTGPSADDDPDAGPLSVTHGRP